jgi:hypothetical protein
MLLHKTGDADTHRREAGWEKVKLTPGVANFQQSTRAGVVNNPIGETLLLHQEAPVGKSAPGLCSG